MASRRNRPWDGADWIEDFGSDLRYALRGLRRTPGFTIGVVLTLALGIGANAAMFATVDRLLLRTPAYLAEPNAVHRVYFTQLSNGKERTESATSYRRYLDVARSTSSFSTVAAVLPFHVAVGTGSAARELPVQLVSASFWHLFNASPVTGRFFRNDDDALPSGSAVAVISYGYWRTTYAGRLDVIGERMRIGTRDFTVVGVAPRGFVGTTLEAPVAYIPFAPGTDETGGTPSSDLATGYGWAWLEVIAQRRPEVTVAAASAALTRAFQSSYASERETTPALAPPNTVRPRAIAGPLLRDRGPLEGDDARIATWLLGVAGTVLLIACANVGNLLLARAFGRRREIAIRLALGARRGRLIRQLLTESALLATFGGALGFAIGQWGGRVLHAVLLPEVGWTGTTADSRALAFAALATLFAALLTGLAPALSVGRHTDATALTSALRERTLRRSRTRTTLLVSQIALSVVLLAGAGLFWLSVHNVRTLKLGFDAPHIVYVRLEMRGEPLSPSEDLLVRERLLARARTLPGVQGAARALNVPFRRMMTKQLFIEGIDSVSRLGQFDLQAVSPGYFEAMGTRILAGRPISAEDGADAPQVIVVSQSMARALWPGKNALGQCVRVLNARAACRTVVGIADDIRGRSLRDDRGLTYYLSLEQFGRSGGGLFVRGRGDAATAAERIRQELQPLMPGASYVTVTPFTDILEPSTRSFELGATMFSLFGTLALIVAAIGLYSVVAFGVAQRTHELGVRVALGAAAPRVVRLVLGESLRVAGFAAAIGIVGVLGAARWIAPLLFNASPRDPRVLTGVPIALVLIAVGASLVPALRAARVDPSVALRAES